MVSKRRRKTSNLNVFSCSVLFLEEEHRNDEKKLLSLLQESQEERDELLAEQVENLIETEMNKRKSRRFFSVKVVIEF